MAPEDPSIISPTRPARTPRILPDSPGIREEPRLRAVHPTQGAGAVTAAWLVVLVVSLAGAVLTGVAWDKMTLSDAVDNLGTFAGAIAYATLGALIVRRARNLIGWFMVAEGAAFALLTAGSAYAIAGVAGPLPGLPAPAAIGALAESAFVLASTGLAVIFLLFPSGRLPSPRWRPAAVASLTLIGVTLAAFVISPRQVALPAPGGISLKFANPLAIRWPGHSPAGPSWAR